MGALQSFTIATPPPSADVMVAKADAPDPAHVGQKLTYTVTVHNNGPDSASGVTLVDTLPKTPGFGSVSTTQGTCVRSKTGVSCSIGTMANAATVTVTNRRQANHEGSRHEHRHGRVDVADRS